MSAGQESGSFPACLVQVPGELREVPVGSIPVLDQGGPGLGFLVSISLPAFCSFNLSAVASLAGVGTVLDVSLVG